MVTKHEMRELTDNTELSDEAKEAILYRNALEFYGMGEFPTSV